LPCDNPLAIGYPSPPSGWVWTLLDICVINIKHHHLAAGPCPAHNNRIHADTQSHGDFSLLQFQHKTFLLLSHHWLWVQVMRSDEG
jgi:hypothetical protein